MSTKNAHTDETEATESTTTALAVVEEERSKFPVLNVSASDLLEEMEEVLNGESISPATLDTVQIPLGGGKMFTLPVLNADNEEPNRKTFDGIIVAAHNLRTYWDTDYSGEASPPTCSSPDGVRGVGEFEYGSAKNPSGMCATCPMSQWGSAKSGKGQACKLKAAVYMILEGQRFPVRVMLPPTSLNMKDATGYRAYRKKLLNHGIRVTDVVTRVGLRQEKFGQTAYSIATFDLAPESEQLNDLQKARARSYAESLKPLLVPPSPAVEADDSETASAANKAF